MEKKFDTMEAAKAKQSNCVVCGLNRFIISVTENDTSFELIRCQDEDCTEDCHCFSWPIEVVIDNRHEDHVGMVSAR